MSEMGTDFSLIAERNLEMRLIPTTATAVEKLKQLAKKTKSKLRITHAEALDRVARGAGYNHWGHVTWCAAETQRHSDGVLRRTKELVASYLNAARWGYRELVSRFERLGNAWNGAGSATSASWPPISR
jgi:hypothetical protein